jgi:hypothetical protein
MKSRRERERERKLERRKEEEDVAPASARKERTERYWRACSSCGTGLPVGQRQVCI